ncbi:hypothetical protein AK812_SmicGene34187 [Symbiodinium microadriaticum]|uniref:t-SNARE coiled-coil homology domain-containing protein n=1 Tax=Symbiodinium microadriaticum TaxID=2951 RepID=A0A1Q9CPP7_SYMMI|nr:hypothetical protein AK812_SmicGene34187 [Symbiodinium microadriaticum]
MYPRLSARSLSVSQGLSRLANSSGALQDGRGTMSSQLLWRQWIPGMYNQELQRRLQRPQAAESSPAPASGEVAKRPSERGAEMQPVSQRSMLERQQQMMRDMDEPLTVLEGSVNNLQQVSTMIRTEINLQNRLLDNANEDVRPESKMLTRFQTLDRHRCLGIAVIALFIALVILFVYEVLPRYIRMQYMAFAQGRVQTVCPAPEKEVRQMETLAFFVVTFTLEVVFLARLLFIAGTRAKAWFQG